jgi:hypothetical protein
MRFVTDAWSTLAIPRTKSPGGKPFRQTTSTAASGLMASLRLFARDTSKDITNLIVSSNVTMMDETPRDPGVAAYFRRDGIDCCIAVNRYATPAQNLQAIVHVIEAERSKLRHGGLNIVRARFRGYAALPPPKGPDGQLAKPWWSEIWFDQAPTLPVAEMRYRELVKTHHPDRGSGAARFNAITDAIRQALQELATSIPSPRGPTLHLYRDELPTLWPKRSKEYNLSADPLGSSPTMRSAG